MLTLRTCISITNSSARGGIAPAIAGNIAQHYGIQYVLYLALGGLICGAIVSSFLQETAPRKMGFALEARLGKIDSLVEPGA